MMIQPISASVLLVVPGIDKIIFPGSHTVHYVSWSYYHAYLSFLAIALESPDMLKVFINPPNVPIIGDFYKFTADIVSIPKQKI